MNEWWMSGLMNGMSEWTDQWRMNGWILDRCLTKMTIDSGTSFNGIKQYTNLKQGMKPDDPLHGDR